MKMHMGRSDGPDRARPFLTLGGRPDGAVSADGKVMGCYLHGLFAADGFRAAFLADLRAGRRGGLAYDSQVERVRDALAGHLERHLDMETLLRLAATTAG